jgi:hypothetical protein
MIASERKRIQGFDGLTYANFLSSSDPPIVPSVPYPPHHYPGLSVVNCPVNLDNMTAPHRSESELYVDYTQVPRIIYQILTCLVVCRRALDATMSKPVGVTSGWSVNIDVRMKA